MDAMAAGLEGDQSHAKDQAGETTSGKDQEIRWVQVATAIGTPNAVIIAGRLESVQIPTRVTQESAGMSTFAVNVGILGTAHVWVPEEYKDRALDLLADAADEEE